MKDCRSLERARTPRSARHVVTRLAAISLAAGACGDLVPTDDALVATLSEAEVVALCDELRDAIDDQLVQCSFGQRHWIVPSNQGCRDAELTNCTASVGDVRAWHELARSEPCSVPFYGAPNDVTFDPQSGCETLVPTLAPTPESCTAASFSRLQTADGVYELVSSRLPAETSCDWPLPAVLDRDAPLFVFVATEASGVPEVILKSCEAVADCQTLAAELREFGEPLSADPDAYRYNHFTGCPWDDMDFPVRLLSRPPAGVPSCQAQWLPNSEVFANIPGPTIVTDTGRRMSPSPGCGYVVAPPFDEEDACGASGQYITRFVSPL